jgi:hypothetical protein
VSQLLPEGIDRLDDVPYTYWNALRVAMGFLTFDELPKDERPPREIWMDHDEMRKHWTAVELRREEKYGGGEDGGPVTKRNRAADDLIR